MRLSKLLLNQGNFLFRYRSYLPLIIIILALFVFISQNKNITKNDYNLVILVSLLMSLFGLGIRILTIGFAAKKTSGRNTKAGQVAAALNTSGLYSIFRHPLYIGNFFMWLGAALLTYNFWFIIAFVLFYLLYYERIIFAEENFLAEKFGASYIEWSDKTGIVFPDLQHYKKPVYAFNLMKALTQEKNGIAAIFILIYIFNAMHHYIYLNETLFVIDIWLVLLIASLLFYIIFRSIQRRRIKRNR